MQPFLDTGLFFIASGILLLLPGFLVLQIFFRNTKPFLLLETFVFSFGISIGLLDFLMLAIGKLSLHINIFSLLLGFFIVLGLLYGITQVWHRVKKTSVGVDTHTETSFVLSRRQGMLFILLLGLTLCIKVIYLMHAVLPTATDLGHHMYWAKLISVTGSLPSYAKQEIITDTENTYQLTNPEPIADFIVGEHVPFAALNMFVGLDFFSAFPILLLLLVNSMSVLALVLLAFRLAVGTESPFLSKKIFTPQNIALTALFFFGPLYTLASPEAKFVSGGVVGNAFGNFLIPLIFLAFYRALKENRPGFLALSFFLIFTLAYTHHLSTLMFLFALATIVLFFCIVHFDSLKTYAPRWMKLLLAPGSLLTALFCVAFFFAIAMPTYIETNALGTAIGTPTKNTRTGLSFLQVTAASGQARIALGLAGCLLLLLFSKQRRYSVALLIGWFMVLFTIAFHPEWLFIDIPSNRIITYLSFPLGLLTAFGVVGFFALARNTEMRFRLPSIFIVVAGLSLFVFSAGDGSLDNNQTLLPKSKALPALQTFSATAYLAENTTKEDLILKDHNYITADAWMKLFFLRDYAYPLSRGFFSRYEDNPNREQCTLLMISIPNTESGKKCYDDLGVRYVLINPHLDTVQFEKSQLFSRVYAADDIHIYERK